MTFLTSGIQIPLENRHGQWQVGGEGPFGSPALGSLSRLRTSETTVQAPTLWLKEAEKVEFPTPHQEKTTLGKMGGGICHSQKCHVGIVWERN